MEEQHASLLHAVDAAPGEHGAEWPAWQLRGACRGRDQSIWFPEQGASTLAAAPLICRRCPVMRQCLRYALDQDDSLLGIWAGTTQEQRRELREREAA